MGSETWIHASIQSSCFYLFPAFALDFIRRKVSMANMKVWKQPISHSIASVALRINSNPEPEWPVLTCLFSLNVHHLGFFYTDLSVPEVNHGTSKAAEWNSPFSTLCLSLHYGICWVYVQLQTTVKLKEQWIKQDTLVHLLEQKSGIGSLEFIWPLQSVISVSMFALCHPQHMSIIFKIPSWSKMANGALAVSGRKWGVQKDEDASPSCGCFSMQFLEADPVFQFICHWPEFSHVVISSYKERWKINVVV